MLKFYRIGPRWALQINVPFTPYYIWIRLNSRKAYRECP